jgi:hypothetical protein
MTQCVILCRVNDVDYEILELKEVVQVGDVFFCRALCMAYLCHKILFSRIENPECNYCGKDYTGAVLKLPTTRSGFRLVAGTRRRPRWKIKKELIRELWEMSAGFCGYCQQPVSVEAYQIDHILPLCAGGTNNLTNLTVSCKACNLVCGGKVFNSFQLKADFALAQRLKKRG